MDTSHPEFFQAEAPASSDLGVVSHCRTPHYKTDRAGHRARGNAKCFLLPDLALADLVHQQVESSVRLLLPVLEEVGLQDQTFLARHPGCLLLRSKNF